MTWQEELNAKRLAGGGWYGCIAPDGWKDIVLQADAMMAFIDPDYKIQQVKEKFGTLRFYYESSKQGVELSILEAIATAAENDSATTCEACGKYGMLRDKRYYIQTLCDGCEAVVAEEAEKRKRK